MQIYTKILIGMAVGATIGLTLGPSSYFLEHDLYKIDEATSVELFADKDEPNSKLMLPAVEVQLTISETVKGMVKDKAGEEHEVPVWARVTFEVSKRMALLDKAGGLQALAKDGKTVVAGDTVEVWLKLDNLALESGVITTLMPISGLGHAVITAISPIGELFMRLIKMVIVPLVFSSLLVGVASLGDVRKLGRLGGKTLGLYLMTTAVAVTIGLVCAHVINPGGFVAEADKAKLQSKFKGTADKKAVNAAEAPSAIENVLNIIPDNPVESLSSGNMLQIIFFAVILGVALTMMGASEAKLIVSFFDKIQQAMVVIIHMVMAVAPFGVAALIAEVVGTSGLSVLGALMVYSITVVVGLAIQAIFVYGGLIRVLTNLKLLDFMRAIRPAQLVAFSTSSSSATLPVSMEVAEENLRVSNPIASFVLPLGSTVNMDGTALYQGVAAIFIAQVFGIDLSIGAQLGIVLTATMASVGAAGVPGAGMVTLAMVLTATGIPTVGVALILGMDRILDMFRTAVNVTGDLAVTCVMAATEGEDLMVMTSKADSHDPKHGFEGRLDGGEDSVEPD